jgi:glycosyltransferase involved in cell wall biosynthesis
MNICQVIFSNGWGGAETVVYELSRHLRDKGENVSIIVNQENIKYYADLENVELFSIGSLYNPLALAKSIISRKVGPAEKYDPSNRVFSLLGGYLGELLRWIYYRRVRKRVRRFLSDNHVDVIHSHLADAAVLVANLEDLRIVKVATPHGLYDLRGGVPVHPLGLPLVKWRAKQFRKSLSKMDKVITVSSYELKVWESQGVPLKGKSVVIYDGVNVSQIQDSLASTSKLKGEFNLLFPGGALFVKGGDLLITALAKVKQEIPNVHLYIARNVPQDHRLRKMVSNLGLKENVTFSGFLPIQEYRGLLNSVDILVMPSRDEVFGIVYVEAMALGKPVIAGNIGGIPEVVKNGRNGILVELDDDQIAEAILYLYRNENIRKEMSQSNLQDVARFDWSHIVDQYIGFYKEAFEARRPPLSQNLIL